MGVWVFAPDFGVSCTILRGSLAALQGALGFCTRPCGLLHHLWGLLKRFPRGFGDLHEGLGVNPAFWGLFGGFSGGFGGLHEDLGVRGAILRGPWGTLSVCTRVWGL